jgi:endonuclease IV
MGGKKMLLQASEEATSYGVSTFLIYTGAPQNTIRKEIRRYSINGVYKHMGNINIVIHAPFIINSGNIYNSKIFEHSIVNDSKNKRGSRKDRHENIDMGVSAYKLLTIFVHHPQLTKLLETPSIGKIKYKDTPYKHEIALLKREISEPIQKLI